MKMESYSACPKDVGILAGHQRGMIDENEGVVNSPGTNYDGF